jgi:hypothetical protein
MLSEGGGVIISGDRCDSVAMYNWVTTLPEPTCVTPLNNSRMNHCCSPFRSETKDNTKRKLS